MYYQCMLKLYLYYMYAIGICIMWVLRTWYSDVSVLEGRITIQHVYKIDI